MSKKIIYGVILQTMAVYGAAWIVPDDEDAYDRILRKIAGLVDLSSLNENDKIVEKKHEIRRRENHEVSGVTMELRRDLLKLEIDALGGDVQNQVRKLLNDADAASGGLDDPFWDMTIYLKLNTYISHKEISDIEGKMFDILAKTSRERDVQDAIRLLREIRAGSIEGSTLRSRESLYEKSLEHLTTGDRIEYDALVKKWDDLCYDCDPLWKKLTKHYDERLEDFTRRSASTPSSSGAADDV